MSRRFTRPSPALIVAFIALFAALAGSSYAEPIRAGVSSLIGGKSIKKRAIGPKHIKRNIITGAHVRESRLGRVPTAKKADDAVTLEGHEAADFADGEVTLSAGRDSGPADAAGNLVRRLETPVGSFDLTCGAANADARYRNTTASNQEVHRTYHDDGSPVGHSFLDAAPDADIGYAATPGTGPALVELSAGSGDTHARLRVNTRRSGTTCTWNWELLVSR